MIYKQRCLRSSTFELTEQWFMHWVHGDKIICVDSAMKFNWIIVLLASLLWHSGKDRFLFASSTAELK